MKENNELAALTVPFDEDLSEYVQEPSKALEFLSACLRESPETFWFALRKLAKLRADAPEEVLPK